MEWIAFLLPDFALWLPWENEAACFLPSHSRIHQRTYACLISDGSNFLKHLPVEVRVAFHPIHFGEENSVGTFFLFIALHVDASVNFLPIILVLYEDADVSVTRIFIQPNINLVLTVIEIHIICDFLLKSAEFFLLHRAPIRV